MLSTAFLTPRPRYLLPPSSSSKASYLPLDVPLGTEALASIPSRVRNVTPTVGRPEPLRISRASTFSMESSAGSPPLMVATPGICLPLTASSRIAPCTNSTRKFMTLVPVCPVRMASPNRVSASELQCVLSAPDMSTPSSLARAAVVQSTRPPAMSVGPSVPSESTAAKATRPSAAAASRVTKARVVSWFGPPQPTSPPVVTVVSPAEMMAHGTEKGGASPTI